MINENKTRPNCLAKKRNRPFLFRDFDQSVKYEILKEVLYGYV